MRTAHGVLLALAFLVTTGAQGQAFISDEVSTDPLPVNAQGLTNAIALAHDDQGTVIAWVMGDETGAARVFGARLDGTNHFSGGIHEMPLVSGNAVLHATAPAVAVLGERVLVAWLEVTSPALLPTINFALCDRDLNVLASNQLTPRPGPPVGTLMIRTSADRFWIVCSDLIFWLTPNGEFSSGSGFGRIADDATMTSGNLQITAHRSVQVQAGCTCPVHGGPFNGFCQPSCVIIRDQPLLYVLTLFGQVDEIAWPMAKDLPVAVRANGDRDDLLVWFSADGGGYVWAARLPSTLPIRGAFPKFTLGVFQDRSRADIATDGTRYVVVWQTRTAAGDHDIAGASVEQDGTVIPLAISTTPMDEHDPSIVATGRGTFLVAYRKDGDALSDRRIAGRNVVFPSRRHAVEH